MSSPTKIDALVERYVSSETPAAAEAALLELSEVAPPGFTIEDAPLGDHLAELAAEAHENDELADAIRLQVRALEHECMNVVRETAVLAALRYEEADATGWPPVLDQFTSARDRADAFSAFASTVIFHDIDLAFTLHDDALDLALKIKDDDELLARVSIPRMLDRRDHDYAPDEPDDYAADVLGDFEDEAPAGGELVGVMYLPREEHAAALDRWPAAAADQHLGTDEYFHQIEADLRSIATEEGRNPELVALSVGLLVEHGAGLDDELPPALEASLTAVGAPATPWPPGRNDACWCASGRKYKRCCG